MTGVNGSWLVNCSGAVGGVVGSVGGIASYLPEGCAFSDWGFPRIAPASAPAVPPTAAAPKKDSKYSFLASLSSRGNPACHRSAAVSKTSVGASAIIPAVEPVNTRPVKLVPLRFASSTAISVPAFLPKDPIPTVNLSAIYPNGAVPVAVKAALAISSSFGSFFSCACRTKKFPNCCIP